jgi:Na+-driven multidrug efflux pump
LLLLFRYSVQDKATSSVIIKLHIWSLLAVFHLLGVCAGVARGCGWQLAGAFVNLASYYVIGLPAAAMLGYYFQFGALVSVTPYSRLLLQEFSSSIIIMSVVFLNLCC